MQNPAPPAQAGSESRVSIIEIVAYAGITAGLYGTFLVLAQEAPGDDTIGLVSLVLTVVFLMAGTIVGAEAPDRLGRLRSVCWYLSVSSFSSMLSSWMISTDSLLFEWSEFLPVFLLTAIYAFGLWLFLPRLLQQFVFYNNALAAAVVLVLPAPSSLAFGSPDLTGLTLVLWVGGAAWFALGYAGRVRPPRTGMVLGLLISIPGPLLFAVDSPEAAFLLTLATSIVYLFLGGRIADRAVSGIAAVGAVVGVVGFLVTIGVDETGTGTATLVVGTFLLVVAVLFARQVGGTARPSFGRPTLPIGARAVPSIVTLPAVPPPPPEPPSPAALSDEPEGSEPPDDDEPPPPGADSP
jgi:hypothetical protein